EFALVRKPDGRLRLVGQESLAGPARPTGFDLDALPTGTLVVTDAKLSFVDDARAGAPLRVFDDVRFELERTPLSMSLRGRGSLPADLGRELRFEARSRGHLAEPGELTWTFAVASPGLELRAWRTLLPAAWPLPVDGSADIRFEGAVAGARVERATGELRFADLMFELPQASLAVPAPAPMEQPADYPLPEGSRPVLKGSPARPDPARFEPVSPAAQARFARAAAQFDYQRTASGGSLQVSDLALEGMAGQWSPSSIAVAWERGSDNAIEITGRASRLVPGIVWPLLAYAPARPLTARLLAADLTGELADIEFTARHGGDEDPEFSVAGRFDGLGTRPFEKVPGVVGLSGRFQASELGGRLELDSDTVTADLPRWFLAPITVGSLQGAITWRRRADGWHLVSDAIDVRSPHGRARGSFELTVPADGESPVLDAVATISDVDASAVEAYLPVGRLRPRSVAWLSQAFAAGQVPAGELTYHGPVRKFPFAAGEGQFELEARVVDAIVSFQPGWPALSEASGQLTFRNQGVEGEIDGGRVGELVVASGRFAVPVLKQPVVSVSAAGKGELARALDYLKASPLAPDLGELLPRVELEGAAGLAVDLELPMRRPRESRFRIDVKVAGASATVAGQPLVASDLTGRVAIIDGGFATAGLEGRLLDGPFRLVASTAPAAAGWRPASQLSATGLARAEAIVSAYDIPATVPLHGETSWQLEGVIESGARRSPVRQQHVLTSDLRGLAIGLPAPLDKPGDATEPLRIELDYDGERYALLRGSTQQGRAVVRVERQGSGEWRLDRGGLRYDGRGAALPDHAGLRIEGDLERVDLGRWFALRMPERDRRWRLRDVLTAASVHVDRLDLWGYEFDDVRGILQQQPHGWQVDLAGPHAQGRLSIPHEFTAGELQADLDVLSVPARAAGDRLEGSVDPRRLPSIRARVGDLTVDKYHLGQVDFRAERAGDGLRIDSLVAQGGSYHAELSGGWLAVPGGTATSVDFTLASREVERTLAEFGYTNAITGTRGYLRGNLTWAGPPARDALGRASGTLRIEIDDGQVLNVEPGAGRVLGLLSLAALPRRLALDFSDLTDKGLAFDSISGDFELRDGTAFTDNLLLRGPAAEVGIAGQTDLAGRSYDQTAVVTGDLGASLGVAGALAGGPAVGAALLLFSQIFKEPLKGMTRGYYRISGPWEDPLIERVVTSPDSDEARAAQVPETAGPEPIQPE
ncbi:MAG TPA: YhdP family protein, partial [Steroidobacteraceae bacterium]|nr:YhdP family protein [Steroidobacteraceae bacterium]